MTFVLAILRLLLLVCLLLIGLLVGAVSFLIPQKVFLYTARLWHRLVVAIVGVRLDVAGAEPVNGALLVCNHISWLDISVLGSVCDCVFLSKSEVRSWPVLGYLVARVGTLFIDRGNGAAAAASLVASALGEGKSVLIFPEGRTTDGMAVRKFQPRLFQPAMDTASPVQPISLAYVDSAGRNSSIPSFTGEESFFHSLWRTLRSRGLAAIVRVFPPVEHGETRDELARESEKIVTKSRTSHKFH